MTPLAHLTCVSSTREKVHHVLEELKAHKIENVLALRGDIPQDGKTPEVYHYASELIHEIKEAGDSASVQPAIRKDIRNLLTSL